MKPLKAIHIPAHRDLYQRSLLRHLNAAGVQAVFGRGIEFLRALNGTLLFNLLRHWPVDIIHLHWQHPLLLSGGKAGTLLKSLLFMIQMLLLKCLGIKFVWTVHNLSQHENRHAGMEQYFTRHIARQSHRIITHCHTARAAVVELYGVPATRVAVIPHGHLIRAFPHGGPNGGSRSASRAGFEVAPGDLLFLFLGLIRPYKGVVDLLETFRRLEGDHLKLMVAGKIPDAGHARQVAALAAADPRISLRTGYIPDPEVHRFMKAADVMVLPYRRVLTSGNAVTGMSFGKPLVAPKLGCLPDVLDARNNYLYDPRTPDGLGRAMREAAADAGGLGEKGMANLRAAQQLEWAESAAKTLEIYRGCAK